MTKHKCIKRHFICFYNAKCNILISAIENSIGQNCETLRYNKPTMIQMKLILSIRKLQNKLGKFVTNLDSSTGSKFISKIILNKRCLPTTQ